MFLSFRKYAFSWVIAAIIFYLWVRSSLPAFSEAMRNNEVCFATENFELHYLDLRNNLGHLLFFSLLTFSLSWETFRRGYGFGSMRMFLVSLLLPVLYGGALELVQEYFFPPRSAEWMDWLYDSLGVLIGWLSASFFVPRFDRLIKK